MPLIQISQSPGVSARSATGHSRGGDAVYPDFTGKDPSTVW
jgi:hypothetical protein